MEQTAWLSAALRDQQGADLQHLSFAIVAEVLQ
jgi:hypothetical protein